MKQATQRELVRRRGSTLVIVISLLGLLAFTGMVFYTFAAQERIASEYFSEAAKATYSEPAEVWPHMLEQILIGTPERYRGSKLYSSSRRHSIVRNMVGSDIYPYSGDGITVGYTGSGASRRPNIQSSVTVDSDGQSLLEFVDSPTVWNGRVQRNGTPEPDVDYTYPDINNLFLAYRGYAIRENANGSLTEVPVVIPSFFRPQYMRSAPTDSSNTNNLSLGAQKQYDSTNYQLRTNPAWAYAHEPDADTSNPPTAVDVTDSNRNTVAFQRRSFRPHPGDIIGFDGAGDPVYRYIADDETIVTDGTIAAGGFPFLPEDRNSNGIAGDLGIWTATQQGAANTSAFQDALYELDADNDLDGNYEGIWLDLQFPIQEFTDSAGDTRKYVVLHSVTIYDLDGLFNLNVHGNLAGLRRTGTLPAAVGAGDFSDNSLSRSHHGLGPNEINPIWGLRRNTALDTNTEEHMFLHFNAVPSNELEAANFELLWTMMGRGEYDNYSVTRNTMGEITGITNEEFINLHGGRWGDKNLLYNSLEQATPRLVISEMPRPGRAGRVYRGISAGPAFNGRDGVDDNQDGREGEGIVIYEDTDDDGTNDTYVVYRRPFGHPVSWSGLGSRTQVDEPIFDGTSRQFNFTLGTTTDLFPTISSLPENPLLPLRLRNNSAATAARWPGYIQYGATTAPGLNTPFAEPFRHTFGPNETYNVTNSQLVSGGAGGDDLNHNPIFDRLLEDPLETIFDHELSDKDSDGIAKIGDLVAMQWANDGVATIKVDGTKDELSEHLSKLAPHALDKGSDNREMFTTLSNALRYIAMEGPFGADHKPGVANRDDDTDGTVDEPDEALHNLGDDEKEWRYWEFSADSDGVDQDNDGLPDGDGNLEFPPTFWTDTDGDGVRDVGEVVDAFTATDPFRPQVRRLLTHELGENRQLVGALPLSINHILDVDRTDETPAEGNAQFYRYMQRSGLRFRSLTEHPHITNYDDDGDDAIEETEVVTLQYPAGTDDSDPNTVESVAEVAYPPQNFSQQEFWARRDRQQLARDIYVLLYTLGGTRQNGTTSVMDYTTTNSPIPESGALYTHQQLRMMAQFAVNMVDAMDTDNVITKFEYDKNLGDGWNLDDDAYTREQAPLDPSAPNYDEITQKGMYIEDAGTRGVVYGVEAQDLAFSEVLAFKSPEITANNHDATLNDDTTGDRDYLFIELQNMRSTTLDLATAESTNAETGIFRIARFDRAASTDPHTPVTDIGSVIALPDPTAAITFETDAGTISGGGNFTISTASNADLGSSDFYLDHDLDGNYDLIAPDVALATLPTNASSLPADPQCDLDLVHTNHSTDRFTLTDEDQNEVTTVGAFLTTLQTYEGNDALQDLHDLHHSSAGVFDNAGGELGFDLVIQRRLNPHMPSLESTSGQTADVNPWIEVDRIRVTFKDLNLQDGDMAADLPNRLDNIKSTERVEPLVDVSVPPSRREFSGTPADHRHNTMGADRNSNTAVGSQVVWQPHFDRDYTSPADLLSLPLFGPHLTTQRLAYGFRAPQQQAENDSGGTFSLLNLASAEAMFLSPQLNQGVSDPATDNRWYRLFQFVEVPSRVHRMLGNYITQNRLPGKVNVNMVRHWQVFAGLVDNPYFTDFDTSSPDRISPFLDEKNSTRDRWEDFVKDRDGSAVGGYHDPTPADTTDGNQATDFWIPGTPGSKPFRSYGHQADALNGDGINETMLRQLEVSRGNSNDNRHWLEVGRATDHSSNTPGATTQVERHQILSKVMNNTTTVSNCFVVFATAAYFEAHEENGLVRVGGRLNIATGDPVDSTNDAATGARQKAVFVIDRTDAYNAYDPASGDFDWQRLIKFEAQIVN